VPRGPLAALCCCALAAGVALGGCGGGGSTKSTAAKSTTLTIYSSMPLQGPARAQSESVVKAEKLALAEAGGRVGGYTVKFVGLDDSTPAAGEADPGQTSVNARKAALDPSAIAYLGEGNAGASAISIPILNEAGILQVSPWDTPAGLTRAQGADKGEPQKYYPSGKRTFARVVPPNNVQAAALVSYQLDKGCTRTYVVSTRDVYALDLSSQFVRAARTGALHVLKVQKLDPGADDFTALAQKIVASGADCMLYAGITADNAPDLFAAVHEADPHLRLFGGAGVADASFAGDLSSAVQRVSYVVSPALDPGLYPPAGRAFFAKYRRTFGRDPDPAAIFGYEAMKLTLLAIQNAGDRGNDQQSVIDALFKIKNHDSAIGTYSIDANGDTTLSTYGGWTIRGGRLEFDKVIRAPSDGG
jgi:branched-chain amino acid transport system substrate-binding protein